MTLWLRNRWLIGLRGRLVTVMRLILCLDRLSCRRRESADIRTSGAAQRGREQRNTHDHGCHQLNISPALSHILFRNYGKPGLFSNQQAFDATRKSFQVDE